MKTVSILIKRNVKLFFKDKGMFFTALITPAILLVLYATFLGNVYRDAFVSGMLSISPQLKIPSDILDGLVATQLTSSILAVSCVTVAFCSNFLMVQDKANGTIKDLTIAPISSSTLLFGYYFATIISTLIICLSATALCLVYVAFMGWYLSFVDVMLLILDVILIVLFGTAISSVINYFLSTQGQISAVGTIISSGYGFICGAYMPISSFGVGLQRVIMFLPGTYATSLLRNHAMNGAFEALSNDGFPPQAVEGLKDAIDCNIYFFDSPVSSGAMFAVLCLSIVLFVGAYILINKLKRKTK